MCQLLMWNLVRMRDLFLNESPQTLVTGGNVLKKKMGQDRISKLLGLEVIFGCPNHA